MTSEEETLRHIRVAIAAMEEEDRIRVASIAASLRNAIAAGGMLAAIALALVGAELAAQS